MTNSEIEQLTITESITDVHKIGQYANVVFGKDKDGNLKILNSTEDHLVIFGASGSGKTRRVLLEYLLTVIHSKSSAIINDAKDEILSFIKPYAEQKGYNIIELDFKNMECSPDTWNPFSLCYELYHVADQKGKAIRMLHNLTAYIFRSIESQNDQYWKQSAISTFDGAASLLIKHCSKKEFNIKNIMWLIDEMLEEMAIFTEYKESPFKDKLVPTERMIVANGYFDCSELKNTDEYRQLKTVLTNARDTRLCILSVLNAGAQKYTIYKEMSDFLSVPSSFDVYTVATQPTLVFIKSSDTDSEMDSMVSACVDQIYGALTTYADETPKRKVPVPCYFLIDECANSCPILDMNKKIATARSRNIHFVLVVQSIAGLRAAYGSDVVNSILTNTSTWVYLRSNEPELLSIIQERLGNVVLPNGRVEPLVSFSDLNELPMGQALILYKGRGFFVEDLPDISEYDLPFEPLEYIPKKPVEREVSQSIWSMKEYVYAKYAKKYNLSLHTIMTGDGLQPPVEEKIGRKSGE